MSTNQNPPPNPSRRLSPDELAGEVAKRLRSGRSERGEHRGRRFDIVTASRIAMVFGILLLGTGVVVAAVWVSRLAGYETPGTVIEGTPVVGCPGEPEMGVLFTGETVQLVGVSEDGVWYAVRDERGPGDVGYADATMIEPEGDTEQLAVRSCEARETSVLAAAVTTTSSSEAATTITTTSTLPTTTTAGETTTTAVPTGPIGGRPRRGTPSPGTTTTTTTTPAPGSSSSTTTPGPGPSSSTTTLPGSTSSTTSTTAPTTTSTTTSTTTTTTAPTTTSSTSTSTTTTSTTTTTAPTTTTTTTAAITTTTLVPEP